MITCRYVTYHSWSKQTWASKLLSEKLRVLSVDQQVSRAFKYDTWDNFLVLSTTALYPCLHDSIVSRDLLLFKITIMIVPCLFLIWQLLYRTALIICSYKKTFRFSWGLLLLYSMRPTSFPFFLHTHITNASTFLPCSSCLTPCNSSQHFTNIFIFPDWYCYRMNLDCYKVRIPLAMAVLVLISTSFSPPVLIRKHRPMYVLFKLSFLISTPLLSCSHCY